MNKTGRQEISIVFVPSSTRPARNEPWEECAALILNPCDGYHHVFARFDCDGEFAGFYDFAGSEPYADDFYVAWALLPDEMPLIYRFDPNRAPPATQRQPLWRLPFPDPDCKTCGGSGADPDGVSVCRTCVPIPPASANQSAGS